MAGKGSMKNWASRKMKVDYDIAMPHSLSGWGIGQAHMPGVYRSLQRTGHGAIARYLGVKGIPGPHNYLAYPDQGHLGDDGRRFTLVLAAADGPGHV